MQRLHKAALIALGYAAALALACAAVAVHMAISDPADSAGGMQAFGDAVLFLGVFAVASLLPTGIALYWLRQHQGFWNTLGVLGLLLALTGMAAAVLYAMGRYAAPPSALATGAGLSVLRLLVSPLCVPLLGLAGLLTRFTGPRRMLLGATALELGVSTYMAVAWFLPMVLQRP
jgi:hypothetical protein